jgi:hypothetical protein
MIVMFNNVDLFNTYCYILVDDSVQLSLDNLLTRLQGRVSSHWYQFGLALGVPQNILEELNDYLDEDALVEILDYWLKNCHPSHQPSWQEVATAVNKAGFNVE